jgi:prenyltransferase beta subunit
MNEMYNMMHARYVCPHKLRKLKITNGVNGGIQRSLVNVTNTYYSIALLCTCRKSLQPKPHSMKNMQESSKVSYSLYKHP